MVRISSIDTSIGIDESCEPILISLFLKKHGIVDACNTGGIIEVFTSYYVCFFRLVTLLQSHDTVQ